MLRDSLIERNHNVGVGIFSSDATSTDPMTVHGILELK
jgi:hypothetical protein